MVITSTHSGPSPDEKRGVVEAPRRSGVPMRDIPECMGERLKTPEEKLVGG